MKPIKTKAEVRREIGLQVSEFLAQGGKVKGVAAGVSGRDINVALPVTFEHKQTTRTSVYAEIQALEARKKNARQPQKTQKRVIKPRKELITDDFGEPIRWVWKDSE